MLRYLLVGSAHTRISTLVEEVARATNGLLVVRRVHDRELRALLSDVHPERRSGPTLLEVDGSSSEAFTGMSLHARLIAVLGFRGAWRVAQLIAEAQTPLLAPRQSRRGLLAQSARVAAGIAGLALLGPAPRWASADDVGTEGKNRPGKYSRKEGIEKWKVKETESGYKVDFEHKKKNASGELKVSFSDHGRTGTMVLKRDYEALYVPSQLPETDRTTLLAVEDVRVLPDGRVSAIIRTDTGTNQRIFVEDDGKYVINDNFQIWE